MSLVDLVHFIFLLLYLVIIGSVVLSYVQLAVGEPSWLYHPALNFIRYLSFRIVRPFRILLNQLLRSLNIRTGMWDFSPLVAIVCLQLFERIIITILLRIGIG